jgi:hypothetical protein
LSEPARILEATDTPSIPLHEDDGWAAAVVGGSQWLANDAPVFEWTQVTAPDDEFDAPAMGASGTVHNPTWSATDFPFTHPFGGDWECFVELDAPFTGLLSSSNAGPSEDYRTATAMAPSAPRSGAHRGVLGIEFDGGMIPAYLAPG